MILFQNRSKNSLIHERIHDEQFLKNESVCVSNEMEQNNLIYIDDIDEFETVH